MGYVFSDELHRGIWAKTGKAMDSIIEHTVDDEIETWDTLLTETIEPAVETTIPYNEEVDAEEVETDASMEDALAANTKLLHIGFTWTPTYSHKSVYNKYKCIYNYTTQRGIQEWVVTPVKSILKGEWVQYVHSEHRANRDLEAGYKEYYIEQNGELLPLVDVSLSEIIELQKTEAIHAMWVCADIEQVKIVEEKCIALGLRPYCVHGGNKKYRAEGSLEEAKQKMESGSIDIILVCKTGIEALDIPMLNTFACFYVMRSPVNLTQGIGRVTRAYPGKTYANVLMPPTKVVYSAKDGAKRIQRKKDGGGLSSDEAKNLWKLDRKDVYYTLSEFTEEYLHANKIYSADHLKLIRQQHLKKKEIEDMRRKLFSQLERRLWYVWLSKSPVIYQFLQDIQVLADPDQTINACMELISYAKRAYLSEDSWRSAISYPDFTKYVSSLHTDDHHIHSDFDIQKHSFLNPTELSDLLAKKKFISRKHNSTPISESILKHEMALFDDIEHLQIRNKLIESTLPLVIVIAHTFVQHMDPDILSWYTLDDIIQECIAENIILTDVYDTQTHTRYYEMICWNTIKTITTLLLKHNVNISIAEDMTVWNSNEMTRLLRILDDIAHDRDIDYGVKWPQWDIEKFDDSLRKQIANLLISMDMFSYHPIQDITDTASEDIEDILTWEDFYATWNRVSKTLTERQKEALEDYLGINTTGVSLELDVIGEKYDITKERARQIKDKAIIYLRSQSRSTHFKQFVWSDIDVDKNIE